jgi:hypothetical protein
MILLRQLFNLAEGGMSEESDTFKHMSAAFTVLRSLGSAQTATNKESSRIGHFIEVQVTDNVLNRTKIHCYFLDQVKKEEKKSASFCIVLLRLSFYGFVVSSCNVYLFHEICFLSSFLYDCKLLS